MFQKRKKHCRIWISVGNMKDSEAEPYTRVTECLPVQVANFLWFRIKNKQSLVRSLNMPISLLSRSRPQGELLTDRFKKPLKFY